MRTTSAVHSRSGSGSPPRSERMPFALRAAILIAAVLLVVGAFYLLAVRGDALLADLAAIVALICG